MPLKIKRVYDSPEPADGKRVLVDRLWPRGLAKKDAKVDLWMKDVAPSVNLRRWFGHRPDRWDEFLVRYKAELRSTTAFDQLRAIASNQMVTLLYAAHDREYNHAVVLLNALSFEA